MFTFIGVRDHVLWAEVSFSIACPKIKWFCPNITWGHLKNCRGGCSPQPPPRTPMFTLFLQIYIYNFQSLFADSIFVIISKCLIVQLQNERSNFLCAQGNSNVDDINSRDKNRNSLFFYFWNWRFITCKLWIKKYHSPIFKKWFVKFDPKFWSVYAH